MVATRSKKNSPARESGSLRKRTKLSSSEADKDEKSAPTAEELANGRNKKESPPSESASLGKIPVLSSTEASKDEKSAHATEVLAGVQSKKESPPSESGTLRKRPMLSVSEEEKDEKYAPTPEELADARTDRSRNALYNWYTRLRELHAYKARYGDCCVPQKYADNAPLGTWVNKQRMEMRLRDKGDRSTMTDHRVNLLNEVGFHWAKPKGQASWDEKYGALCEFYKLHGHCRVPTKYREDSALGRWMSTQRSQWKEWTKGAESSMTKERYEKLKLLGFEFEGIKKQPGESKSDENTVEPGQNKEGEKVPEVEPDDDSYVNARVVFPI